MKLSLAVALPMALLATAAPTALKLKRDDVQDANIASKIASESLKTSIEKSAASMMAMFNDDNAEDMGTSTSTGTGSDTEAYNKPEPDYGATMTPNSNINFPSVNGKMPESQEQTNKGAQKPTPTEDEPYEETEEDDPETDDAGVFEPAASVPVIPSAPAPSSSAAAPSPSASAAASSESEEAMKMAAASATPSASASAKPSAKPKSSDPLGGLLGNLGGLGGLLGGI